MNEFVPRGYLTLKKALEHFGKLKHGDKWEAEKASSQQEFQQLLFEGTVPAEHFIGGRFFSLESSIWGTVETERIFETEQASRSVGNEYFPDVVYGPVLIKQSSIDALFDGDSDDPSRSSKGETAKTGTGDAGLIDDDVPVDEQTVVPDVIHQPRPERGRPPKYLWDDFWREVVRIADLDGLPETQAELEEVMAQWCEDNWNEQPGTSTIREKIAPCYQRDRQGQ